MDCHGLTRFYTKKILPLNANENVNLRKPEIAKKNDDNPNPAEAE